MRNTISICIRLHATRNSNEGRTVEAGENLEDSVLNKLVESVRRLLKVIKNNGKSTAYDMTKIKNIVFYISTLH